MVRSSKKAGQARFARREVNSCLFVQGLWRNPIRLPRLGVGVCLFTSRFKRPKNLWNLDRHVGVLCRSKAHSLGTCHYIGSSSNYSAKSLDDFHRFSHLCPMYFHSNLFRGDDSNKSPRYFTKEEVEIPISHIVRMKVVQAFSHQWSTFNLLMSKRTIKSSWRVFSPTLLFAFADG